MAPPLRQSSWIVSAIVGILVLGFVIYWIAHKDLAQHFEPAPEAGWQTYENPTVPFGVQYPAGWGVIDQDVLGTMRVEQRKADGFELQTPADEYRMVTVHDALIYFFVENKADYYQSTVYADGSMGTFVCHSPEAAPVYTEVMKQRIEICLVENAESVSYPEELQAYVPIDEEKGLVMAGMHSKESKSSTESFLQTFTQVASTLVL